MVKYDAFLSVCFGTAKKELFCESFMAIHLAAAEKAACKYSAIAVTGTAVKEKLAADGLEVPDVKEALSCFKAQGAKNVFVLSLFLADGTEFKKLKELCGEFEGEFDTLTVSQPVLTTQAAAAAAIIAERYPLEEKRQVILVGHGSADGENDDYEMLAGEFVRGGRSDVSVILLHEEQNYDLMVTALIMGERKKVTLAPLMFTAGHHIKEAFEGDLPEAFRACRLETEIVMEGLASIEDFRTLCCVGPEFTEAFDCE